MSELRDMLIAREKQKFATTRGTDIHRKLQHIVIDGDTVHGDIELISKIKHACGAAVNNIPSSLQMFFCANAKTEVPIAGVVNGKFISRRIDRMMVHDNVGADIISPVANTVSDIAADAAMGQMISAPTGIVYFLDYKTDIDKNKFYDKYIAQIREYETLLRGVYPNHEIHGFILWTHDWVLEKIS